MSFRLDVAIKVSEQTVKLTGLGSHNFLAQQSKKRLQE